MMAPSVCAFPYILAFTADSIEVRLVINGNLIQAMVMPRLSLITSKSDVFFATTAPEFFSLRGTRMDRMDHKDSSPPSSPHCNLPLPSSSLTTLFFISNQSSFGWSKQIAIFFLSFSVARQISASPDGKPFRLYRIQLNNLGGTAAGNCTPTPVSTTPVPVRTVNRR